MRHTLATFAIALLISSSLLCVNVWQRQQAQYRDGMAGEARGDFMVALTGYESAIRMYLPFSPTIERSAERIWALGLAAEQRHDPAQALVAYRSLRSAFYAVRWLLQPGEDWIKRCDAKIAALIPRSMKEKP